MSLPHIHSVGFSCREADSLAAWYQRWLGFELVASHEHQDDAYCQLVGLAGARLRRLILQLGEEQLELSEVRDPGPHRPGRALPPDSRSNDLWFQHICLVTPDLATVATGLQEQIAAGELQPISSAPQRLPDWNPGAAGIIAFKLHDPQGHPLELLQFPPDKGDARWHRATTTAVLGIDHSAIGSSDPQRTARFYSDLLGIPAGGGGTNSGVEQDRLDGLSGTEVRIGAWRPATGMGIESLAYRQPAGGRPQPADFGAQDLSHWQIRLEVDDLERIAAAVGEGAATAAQGNSANGRLISAGIIELEGCLEGGWRRGLQLADPDGHRLQLLSR